MINNKQTYKFISDDRGFRWTKGITYKTYISKHGVLCLETDDERGYRLEDNDEDEDFCEEFLSKNFNLVSTRKPYPIP